jgi:adenosylcobinamide-phosphate synthase
VAEAAFAAAMGVRLGGVNDYDGREERRPDLGFGRPADASDIEAARALSRDVTTALAVSLALLGGIGAVR